MSDIKFNKPVSKNESGVLSAIWRNILKENNLIPALDLLVQRYVDRGNRAKELKDIKLKNKSTLTANITAPEMTFKTFLDLLFNFLHVKKITFSVKLTFQNGSETVHTINVDKQSCDDGGHDEYSKNNAINPKHSQGNQHKQPESGDNNKSS